MKKALVMASVLLLYSFSAHAQRGDYRGMHDWMMGYGAGGWIMWLLLLILIGVIIYFIMQSARNRNSSGTGSAISPGETPMDILKRRYAKGEITREEYERMKKDLEI